MTAAHKPLHRFMLGVLVFFPFTFALWYFTAAWHLAPVAWLTEVIIKIWMPDSLLWLRLDGNTLVLASNFGHDAQGMIVSPPVSDDLLGFHLNPLIYAYSLPLLFALILATPNEDKFINLLWGLFLIVPTEVFSMVFSVLKTLTFDIGAPFQQQQHITPWMAELIAFAYQTGTLIVPMVAPLVIWIMLNHRFIVQLAPQLQQVFAQR